MSIVKWLLKIYSYFPMLSVTDDNNFGTNEGKANGLQSYRLSLLNLCCGHRIYYFFTYSLKSKKIKFLHIVELEKCGSLYEKCDADNIDSKTQKYNDEHLIHLTLEDQNIEKEFLNYLIDNESSRIEVSNKKINLYMTIILAVIPIVIAFFDIRRFLNLTWYEKTLAGIVCYCIFNVAKFVFDSVKVQGIEKSQFQTLKNSNNKQPQILMNYYFDWQMLRGKADLWVSYVKNIENWIKYTIILVIVFAVTVNTGTVIDDKISPILITSNNIINNINIDNMRDPFSFDSKVITETHLRVKKRETKALTIIGRCAKENADEILQQFLVYEPVIHVNYYIDTSLQNDRIFKILEGVD